MHSTHGGTTNCMEVLTLEFGVDSTARKPNGGKELTELPTLSKSVKTWKLMEYGTNGAV